MEQIKNKKILVTGSNGFIGSNVCKYLKKQGAYVIGLGRRPESGVSEIDEYIQCELSGKQTMDILKLYGIDAVVHLAADMRHDPGEEIEVVYHNCVGTQQLLEACETYKVPVFVQLSSLPVIGRPVEHPITEQHPLKPLTVYHVTKNTQEMLANYASYKHGLRTVSYRICSPIGVGMNQKTIFPTFVRNALTGKDIVLYGKGTREQTYIHVEDIAQAICRAIISVKVQGVYNLASTHRISNVDLAKLCISVLNSSSKLVYNGIEDPLDTDVWDVSLEHLVADTGFETTVSLEYAIREQAEALRKQI